MTRTSPHSTHAMAHSELQAQLAQLQPAAGAAARGFSFYAQALFATVAARDALALPQSQQAARVQGFWQWGQHRPQATVPHIRLHNPPVGGGHWREDVTFIEIICDDMPFLVDSITAELNRQNLEVQLFLHPVYSVQRTAGGELIALQSEKADGWARESWMHVTIERQSPEAMESIAALLHKVLADVRLAVADWKDMRGAVRRAMAVIASEQSKADPTVLAEAEQFLDWLDNDHFVFLGYREYTLNAARSELVAAPEAARGLLRDSDVVVLRGLRQFENLPEPVRALLDGPELLFVNKARGRSAVHRPVPYDIVGVKQFDEQGRFAGLRLFIGLFTSMAYSRNAQDIPWLRLKLGQVIAASGLDPRSHSGKALVHILNTYPRDDLFQIGANELSAITTGILLLAERQRTALFVWHDPFGRFVSAIVYTPRDRYDTALRQKFFALLEKGFAARVSGFTTAFAENPLVRLQVTLETESTACQLTDLLSLENDLIDAARGWDDRLADALMALHAGDDGRSLRAKYAHAFSPVYRATVAPAQAAADIAVCEQVQLGTPPLALTLHSRANEPAGLTLRLFHKETALALSDVLPRLENMGLRIICESSSVITAHGRAPVWLSELETQSRSTQPIVLADVQDRFITAFHQLWAGELEDDRLNALVLGAGLAWREVAMLRSYAKYLQQTGFAPTPSFIRDTLLAHPAITARFVALFHARFEPAQANAARAATLTQEIESALEKVSLLAEDEVLRRYLNLLQSTVRTNYYLNKPYLSFKLESGKVAGLPLPRPYAEIFVYSPRVEGIHLRGGKVARGGIRWSDRRDDYRTEVLGLMKAQQVKNAVIVPVGSKGGFYCKQLPADKAAEGKEVIACYQTFIRGLLDVTDNLAGESIIPPKGVVRHDGDDPYLVVAADKGTAKFSDIANALSQEYGFWLGDAFASGGSAGYDHKHMGITARGAWESVKRHFRELGKDIQSADFTCVGVGDMAGDVFGNGMLLSRHTRLLAAFNHKHIFIDPAPDVATSFAERQRLFDLPGSQWSDYAVDKISAGGGVYERSAKTITLSPQARTALGISEEKLSPAELIRQLLQAPVELLYLGGIGTYIKASSESHAEVSDKTNDTLRVDAATLRCAVVGEGANLGFTAQARIEYARKGGRINSDAIDNSAGVDTSDHEVNIKIALQPELARLTLTKADRDTLLKGMTDDVAALVLRDNYLQTQLISFELAQAPQLLDAHARLLQVLEKSGRLDRKVEFLPSDAQLAQRASAGEGLTRPELGLLLAYSKMALFDDILASSLPDDPALATVLQGYFPPAMQQRFAASIATHRLRREIIATVLANEVVNRMGCSFILQLTERLGHTPVAVVRAWLAVRTAMDLPALWAQIEALDNHLSAAVQVELLQAIALFAIRATSTTLALPAQELAGQTAALRQLWSTLKPALSTALPASSAAKVQAQAQSWGQAAVPEALATAITALAPLASGPRILQISQTSGVDALAAATAFYAVGAQVGCDKLRGLAMSYHARNYWQRQQAMGLADELGQIQQTLTCTVLASKQSVASWLSAQQDMAARTQAFITELTASGQPDLSMLTMAIRALKALQ